MHPWMTFKKSPETLSWTTPWGEPSRNINLENATPQHPQHAEI